VTIYLRCEHGGRICLDGKALFSGNEFAVNTVKRVFWMLPPCLFKLGVGEACAVQGRLVSSGEMVSN